MLDLKFIELSGTKRWNIRKKKLMSLKQIEQKYQKLI